MAKPVVVIARWAYLAWTHSGHDLNSQAVVDGIVDGIVDDGILASARSRLSQSCT